MHIDKLERRISQNSSEGGGDNEGDFFDHDSHKLVTNEIPIQRNNINNGALSKPDAEDGAEPSVEAALSMSPTLAQETLATRKPTIGQRKTAKKGGVSAYLNQG